MIFSQMGIDTHDVIEAAATKWNFIKLQPGLVGGHCIGVDPYYLVHKSMSVGHIPDIIRTAREINDGMARFVAGKLVKAMIQKGQQIKGAKVLVMGLTFKENCPDVRNTKVVDLIKELESYGMNIDIYDPWVNKEEVKNEYDLDVLTAPKNNKYDAIVLAVAHDQFKEMENEITELLDEHSTVLDMKKVMRKNNRDVVTL